MQPEERALTFGSKTQVSCTSCGQMFRLEDFGKHNQFCATEGIIIQTTITFDRPLPAGKYSTEREGKT